MENEKPPNTGVTRWMEVKSRAASDNIKLGSDLRRLWFEEPERLLAQMSFARYAARIFGGPQKTILDLNPGEGLTTWLLARECGHAYAYFENEEDLSRAQKNWNVGGAVHFEKSSDFKEKFDGIFWLSAYALDDQASSLDVLVGKIESLRKNLKSDGLIVFEVRNLLVPSREHLNIEQQFRSTFHGRFQKLFIFGTTGEIVHSGFLPMCQSFLLIGFT